MKTILFAATAMMLLAVGCTKAKISEESTEFNREGHRCYTQQVLAENLLNDPSLAQRMARIEEFTKQYLKSGANSRILSNEPIEIPVFVNVLFKTEEENITDERINSQIEILNKDFSAANIEYSTIPAIFNSVASGDFGIRFTLAGVKRHRVTRAIWQPNDFMKMPSKGGVAPTNPETMLNLWSCNMGRSILGYAQFPGGNPATDGVVIDDNAFGVNPENAPYGLGRTATHEIGHWLNLLHVWGDDGSACTGSDEVDDTPNSAGPNFGCPGIVTTCGNTRDMTMNYMDYTDDACMYMFTLGQKQRAHAAIIAARAGLLQ